MITIISPAEGDAITHPVGGFAVVRLAGAADPGALVSLSLTGFSTGVPVHMEATADQTGAWAGTASLPVDAYVLQASVPATATTPAGGSVPVTSTAVRHFSVPGDGGSNSSGSGRATVVVGILAVGLLWMVLGGKGKR